MKKVSIVVPVYNMGDKIEVCVNSLIKQSYSNIEIILVDDGSKDDSLEHCRKLEKMDSRIRVFHTENRGSGPARNYGIMNATGDYIYFPDADDFLELNAIEALEKTMREGKFDLIVFGYKNVTVNGDLRSIKEYPDMVKSGKDIRNDYSDYMTTISKYGIQGAPWNKFFDLEIIKKNEICFPELRRHQDEGFIARYVSCVDTVCFVSDVFYTYYTNDLSKEWDKYPVDYICAVNGLFAERKKNILIWNKEDNKVHDLVYKEYICGLIKSLELSFSPKFQFNKQQRKKWMRENIENSELLSIPVPNSLGKYQKMILQLVRGEKIDVAYILLHLKVVIEKNGFLRYFKRV